MFHRISEQNPCLPQGCLVVNFDTIALRNKGPKQALEVLFEGFSAEKLFPEYAFW